MTSFNMTKPSILEWYEVACSQDSRDLRKAAWTYIPYSNANIKALVGFELGYGTNKEARISMWKPRYLKEDEEGLETLDVEAVIDRDVRLELVMKLA
jgi:hypothetical protein